MFVISTLNAVQQPTLWTGGVYPASVFTASTLASYGQSGSHTWLPHELSQLSHDYLGFRQLVTFFSGSFVTPAYLQQCAMKQVCVCACMLFYSTTHSDWFDSSNTSSTIVWCIHCLPFFRWSTLWLYVNSNDILIINECYYKHTHTHSGLLFTCSGSVGGLRVTFTPVIRGNKNHSNTRTARAIKNRKVNVSPTARPAFTGWSKRPLVVSRQHWLAQLCTTWISSPNTHQQTVWHCWICTRYHWVWFVVEPPWGHQNMRVIKKRATMS